MTQLDTEAVVYATVARILAEPIDRRVTVFAEAMQDLLDGLAARYPRSTPRELVRMAQAIGRAVLDRLHEANR